MKYLYKINVGHFAPKDGHESIQGYVIAMDDKDVYEWLASDPNLLGEFIITCWLDREKEEEGELQEIKDSGLPIDDEENFKEKMIRLHGELYDGDADYSDLYYGKTFYGWEKIRELTQTECEVLLDLGIAEVIK